MSLEKPRPQRGILARLATLIGASVAAASPAAAQGRMPPAAPVRMDRRWAWRGRCDHFGGFRRTAKPRPLRSRSGSGASGRRSARRAAGPENLGGSRRRRLADRLLSFRACRAECRPARARFRPPSSGQAAEGYATACCASQSSSTRPPKAGAALNSGKVGGENLWLVDRPSHETARADARRGADCRQARASAYHNMDIKADRLETARSSGCISPRGAHDCGGLNGVGSCRSLPVFRHPGLPGTPML